MAVLGRPFNRCWRAACWERTGARVVATANRKNRRDWAAADGSPLASPGVSAGNVGQVNLSGGIMRVQRVKTAAVVGVLFGSLAAAAHSQAAARWVDAWTTGEQATYPAGYAVGQPGNTGPVEPNTTGPLLTHAFPQNVANNQTLRMIIHPSIGGRARRQRLTNVFGTSPVTFGRVRIAVQSSGATIVRGSSRALTFAGRRSVSVAAGKEALSDPVRLRLATRPNRNLAVSNLAVSLHVRGTTAPMTWH